MTVDQVLQGRVPGLVVASGSGQPGASARVTLRGVNTITGSTSVLYIMDGIPIESGNLQNINPSDIESVTVLKDASAKALYGSRGSNGVIVITTKRGKSGRIAFDYKSQYGFSNLSSPTFKMMNAAEHLRFEEEVGLETNAANAGPGWTYSSKNPVYATKSPAEQQRYDFILDSLRNINTDWRKFFFQTGKFMEQQLSASGGSENIRFYSSLNFYNQEGIAVRSGMKRFTLKNNVDFNTKRFTGSINLTLGYAASSFIESEGASSGNNPLSAVYYALPYEYPFYPNDTLVHSGNTSRFPVMDLREGSNAYERLLNTSNKSNQLKGIWGTSLNYTIADGLVAKTRFGIDFRQTLDEAFINPDSYSGTRVTNGRKGSFSEGSRRYFGFTSTSGLTYSKKFASLHDIEVSGLFEYNFYDSKNFNYIGYGIEGRLPETPAGITAGSATNSFIPVIAGSRTSSALNSYIAIGRYTFNDKYTLNASYRYDGSSTVPANNRWHGFYSIGLNWEAKKENFLEDVDLVSGLRVRASYGTTASPFSRDFGYVATYVSTSYGGNQGIRPSAPGNPDYDWEYAKEANVGFDLGLLKSRRIRVIMDVYDKTTTNLFFNRPLSITSGFSFSLINSGSVNNRGIEVDLQVDVIKNKTLTWTVGGNYSYNKNKVVDLGGSDEFENGFTGIVRVGLPLGSHFAPKWAGVDPATGNPQYYTRDGQITTTYNAAQLNVAEFGTYLPAVTGGLNTSLLWKGLSINALFSYMDKVFRYNNEDYYNENPSFRTSNQSTRMLYDRWKKPGDIAILPRIGAPRNYTSRDIYDASFIRFRNLNIGYNLPIQLVNRIGGIRGIHLFVQAENLHVWTKWRGFDPENGNEYARYSYPSPRTYTAGLNVNF
ncbi:SusC/RagA family TonB-linked outer membrane protein [Segetibacter sp. 3557_3]|uniref:SusC/RagA family TonB-linked outer membrane protein n=1 Tax=Segetibacter sp. 3557_3 TaxID=2547429 RepID=UPI0010590BAB|nr:SusC/RagA family TonB-linked outer membrane protein [Segetibacter sp. 3557_3]